MKTLAAFCCAIGLSLSAQQSRTAIDNDQVKVLDVTVQPHQKTKLHQHTVNRVMVYLQPGRQSFEYQDGKNFVQEWKAGEPKWSPASGMHIAEITSNNAVRIVEIELKKPGSGVKMPLNPLDPVKVDPQFYKVAIENDQVRVLKVRIGPHETAPMHAHALNRVVVYLTDINLRVKTQDGKEQHVEHKAGEIVWGTPTTHFEENLNGTPVDLIAVEIKN